MPFPDIEKQSNALNAENQQKNEQLQKRLEAIHYPNNKKQNAKKYKKSKTKLQKPKDASKIKTYEQHDTNVRKTTEIKPIQRTNETCQQVTTPMQQTNLPRRFPNISTTCL